MNEDKQNKFFDLAVFQANLFSKDPNKKVCALFVSPNSHQILSSGYNGMPRGINDTDKRWERPEKYKYVVHAETNGIYNACRNGVSLEDSICFITMFPCSNCTKALIQVGVKKIITKKPRFEHERWGDDYKYSTEMLDEAGIHIKYLNNIKIEFFK